MNTTMQLKPSELLEYFTIQEYNKGICTGSQWEKGHHTTALESFSPTDGMSIGKIEQANKSDLSKVIRTAQTAFEFWRQVPAPKRGEIVRQIGNELRANKEKLGAMISYEMGKIYQEGVGEVQEMIDICDFAVGQSRQLYGFTMHSERANHKMQDQYHPLGVVAVITAFNFPMAVWAWNAMIGMVCGNVMLWKPSSKVPFCALAVHKIVQKVLKQNQLPEGILNLVVGESKEIGDDILNHAHIPLVSATGSVTLGKRVARLVAQRLGRSLLELGGNNALIITPTANMEMALKATLFGAVGTAGQRCTTTRRLIIHSSIYEKFVASLRQAYIQVSDKIGHPLDSNTLIGPLIDKKATEDFISAQREVVKQGGKIVCGGEICTGDRFQSGCYVVPCLAEVPGNIDIVKHETFAPLLYAMKYDTFDEAVTLNNEVPQGLSSAIFTNDIKESEYFMSHQGSDCGIANINIGTSGAEIGGAFGGEKETGGGRESGSDAWKVYMRRQTNTINYGSDMPLAQGIEFDI